jgi:hypothetical protein
VVAQVLGHPVRAKSAEEMRYLILRELTDRYASERGIVVSQAEVDAYVARQRQALAADPNVTARPATPPTKCRPSAASRLTASGPSSLALRPIESLRQFPYPSILARRNGTP